jgi:hypothetical protein
MNATLIYDLYIVDKAIDQIRFWPIAAEKLWIAST